MASGDTKRSI